MYKQTGFFAVNILGEHCDPLVIGNFGFKSGRDSNKFSDYDPLIKSMMPIVPKASGYITCKVIDKWKLPPTLFFWEKLLTLIFLMMTHL